jgi:hypothetical protein
MIKDAQVGVLRRRRMAGKTQETSAAAAGMSVRSARKWEHGLLPSQRHKPRTWRTRKDPFTEAFESEVEPLLAEDSKGVLEATTLLTELNRRMLGLDLGCSFIKSRPPYPSSTRVVREVEYKPMERPAMVGSGFGAIRR